LCSRKGYTFRKRQEKNRKELPACLPAGRVSLRHQKLGGQSLEQLQETSLKDLFGCAVELSAGERRRKEKKRKEKKRKEKREA
jgi:hypothetical protein